MELLCLSKFMFIKALKNIGAYVVLSMLLIIVPGEARTQDIFGTSSSTLTNALEFENITFTQPPRFPNQVRSMNSIALRPKLVLNWQNTESNKSVSATLTPLLRFDPNDTARTHADFREAKFDFNLGKTEFTLGYDYVFWGKAESAQIVDIVNQVDMLEAVGGKNKLGQPMLALRKILDIGGEHSVSASVYYLPYFRERTYLGRKSRLRFGSLVDNGIATYANGASQSTPSFAGRLASTVGNLDLALSAFRGISREPIFQQILQAEKLIPVYGKISQVGFEGQITGDATLWKLEAIDRNGQFNARGEKQNYFATVVGIEHTLYGFGGRNADLGIIMEYAWDSRQQYALTPLQNDIILGGRIAMNDIQDSSILFTASVDVKTRETLLRSEYKSRLTDRLFFTVETSAFLNTTPNSIMYNFRNDHYIRSSLTHRW